MSSWVCTLELGLMHCCRGLDISNVVFEPEIHAICVSTVLATLFAHSVCDAPRAQWTPGAWGLSETHRKYKTSMLHPCLSEWEQWQPREAMLPLELELLPGHRSLSSINSQVSSHVLSSSRYFPVFTNHIGRKTMTWKERGRDSFSRLLPYSPESCWQNVSILRSKIKQLS